MSQSLDVTPTQGEVQIAIRQLSSGKELGSDSIPAEIYKEGGSALTGELLTLFSSEWKNHNRRTSKTLPSFIFTNGKGTDTHAIITMESPYFQFWAISSAKSFWIASTTISNMDSYQRINPASVRNVGPLTWCSLQGSFKRSVRNRTLTSTRFMLIWPRHLKWSAETAYGKSWQNKDGPKNSSPSLDNTMTAFVRGYKTTEKAPWG